MILARTGLQASIVLVSPRPTTALSVLCFGLFLAENVRYITKTFSESCTLWVKDHVPGSAGVDGGLFSHAGCRFIVFIGIRSSASKALPRRSPRVARMSSSVSFGTCTLRGQACTQRVCSPTVRGQCILVTLTLQQASQARASSSFFSDGSRAEEGDDSTVDAGMLRDLLAENAGQGSAPRRASSSRRSSMTSRRKSQDPAQAAQAAARASGINLAASFASTVGSLHASTTTRPGATLGDVMNAGDDSESDDEDVVDAVESPQLQAPLSVPKRAHTGAARQTVSPDGMMQLMEMLGDVDEDETDDDAAAAPSRTTSSSLLSASAVFPTRGGKAPEPRAHPRSCLSARKPQQRRARTSRVAFGSPQTAEFRRDSPASHWTPVPKAARSRLSTAGHPAEPMVEQEAVAEEDESTGQAPPEEGTEEAREQEEGQGGDAGGSPSTKHNDELLSRWEDDEGTPTRPSAAKTAPAAHDFDEQEASGDEADEQLASGDEDEVASLPRRSPRIRALNSSRTDGMRVPAALNLGLAASSPSPASSSTGLRRRNSLMPARSGSASLKALQPRRASLATATFPSTGLWDEENEEETGMGAIEEDEEENEENEEHQRAPPARRRSSGGSKASARRRSSAGLATEGTAAFGALAAVLDESMTASIHADDDQTVAGLTAQIGGLTTGLNTVALARAVNPANAPVAMDSPPASTGSPTAGHATSASLAPASTDDSTLHLSQLRADPPASSSSSKSARRLSSSARQREDATEALERSLGALVTAEDATEQAEDGLTALLRREAAPSPRGSAGSTGRRGRSPFTRRQSRGQGTPAAGGGTSSAAARASLAASAASGRSFRRRSAASRRSAGMASDAGSRASGMSDAAEGEFVEASAVFGERTEQLGSLASLLEADIQDSASENDEEDGAEAAERTETLGSLTSLLQEAASTGEGADEEEEEANEEADEEEEEEEARLLAVEARLLRESGVAVEEGDRRRSRSASRGRRSSAGGGFAGVEVVTSEAKRPRGRESVDAAAATPPEAESEEAIVPVEAVAAAARCGVVVPPSAGGAYSAGAEAAGAAARERFRGSDVAALAAEAESPADGGGPEGAAKRMAASLTAGVEVMVLRWAGEQLASQRAALAAAVDAAMREADGAASAALRLGPRSARVGASPLVAAGAGGAEGAAAVARLRELAGVAGVACGAYLDRWRGDVTQSLAAALRRGAAGVEGAADRAGEAVGALRGALAGVRAEAARVRAARQQAEAEAARAEAVAALEEETGRLRARREAVAASASEEAARQVGVGTALAAVRADAARLEAEAEAAAAASASLALSPSSSSSSSAGRGPTSSAVDRARDRISRFAALCAASPWAVEASSGGPEGGEWRLRAEHADGSCHVLQFRLGGGASSGGSRAVSGWRVTHKPGSPAASSAGGAAAFSAAVYARACAAALAAVGRAGEARAVGGAVLAAGAAVRESGLLVARALAAQRRSSVALEAAAALLQVDSVAGRCSVQVRVPIASLAALEAAGAAARGVRGLRTADGTAVQVGTCAGRAEAAAVQAKVVLALSGVQAGPGVLARAVAATRQGIEAAVRDA